MNIRRIQTMPHALAGLLIASFSMALAPAPSYALPGPVLPRLDVHPATELGGQTLFDLNPGIEFDVSSGPLGFATPNPVVSRGCQSLALQGEICFFDDAFNTPLHWHWETKITNTNLIFSTIPVIFRFTPPTGIPLVFGGVGGLAPGSTLYVDWHISDIDPGPMFVEGWFWEALGSPIGSPFPSGIGIDTSIRESGPLEIPGSSVTFIFSDPNDFFTEDLNVMMPTVQFSISRVPEPSSLLLFGLSLTALAAGSVLRRRQ